MNQTQTRSLRKKVLSLILAVVMVVSLLPISAFASGDSKASTADNTDYYKILHLDCGRKYFSKDWIIALLNEMSADGYNQLQLAFGNDGLRFLLNDMASDETVVKKVEAGNEKQNESGDKRWLSQTEMDEIIAAADKLGIEIVPLLNLPGHANTILDIEDNDIYNAKVGSVTSQNTLDVTNENARNFAYALFTKYVDYFAGKGCKYFNFGADEYCNDVDEAHNPHFNVLEGSGYQNLAAFMNQLAAYIDSKGMTPRTFNDALYYNKWSNWNMQTGTNQALRKIECCYWSSGWDAYPVATASQISGKGHAMINTNGDYYYVLGKDDAFTPDKTTAHDANLYTAASGFDKTAFAGNTMISNPAGSMFCIWSDYPKAETEQEVAKNVRLVMRAMALRMDDKSIDKMDEGVVTGGFNSDGTLNKASTGDSGSTGTTTEKTITVAVGQTDNTVTIDGRYGGTLLDDDYATVTGKENKIAGTKTYDRASLTAGEEFFVSTKANDTAPTANLTFEAAGNGQYYIKNAGGQYIYPDATYTQILFWGSWGNWRIATGKQPVNVSESDGAVTISRTVTSGNESTISYLTLSSGNIDASDKSTNLYLYTEKTDTTYTTTLSFTGKSVGDTSVKIGDVTYKIHVVAEDLSKVTPLTIEYWITNGPVLKDKNSSTTAVSVSATKEIATETGVSVAALVPGSGIKESEKNGDNPHTLEYWQAKLLNKSKPNNSSNGTEEQTTRDGDDETLSGSAFTKVRYWGGTWQVYTTEWVTVKSTDQLVAYYMEVINIKNKNNVENLHVNAADWGLKGDGTTALGYNPGDTCSVSVQLVYEDGSTSPSATTAAELKSKTIVYSYWNGGRGLGTMVFNGKDNYQIFKVTAETGDMSSTTSSKNTVTVNSFTWDDNEETVWEGAATDSVSIGNPVKNPSYDTPYDNLAWNTSEHNNNNAILIRVYVKSIPKAGALTVNYFVQGNADPFYHYGINVFEETTFDADFGRVEDANAPGKARLINNSVTNYDGEQQEVQSDLSKMTEIGAQYRYSNYTFTNAERSTDGKTVNLYYTFNWNKAFVVDFGLPVVIRPNDVNENLKNATLTAAEITQSTTYANISVDNDKNITYTLKQTIDGEDNFSVRYMGNITTDTGTQTGQVDYSIKVIPATSVYYEDSFATFTNADGTKNVAQVDNADKGIWTKVTDGTTQTNVNQALEELGGTTNTKNVYGYDQAYAGSSKFSMGSATKVTVAADTYKEGKTQWPTATFSFKGTGFDVISLTDNNSGAISVKVYSVGNDGTETQVKGTLVNNYYGYTYSDGKWTVTPTGGNNALYQIPVIKISGLDYGTYKVVITASYATFADKTGDGQYNFWLDAIRVYDPMGKDNATYEQDNEGYPQYIKLRDSLVGETATAKNGSVFIDGADKADIATYANYGPNNEVYLAKGQAISFKLTGALDSIASVQIGAKSPDGTDGAAVISVNGQKVTTATEMYYAITDTAKSGNQVTIANNGTGILSLTNLKITYTESGKSVSLDKLSAADQENAVAQVRALFAAPAVEPFNPDRFDASWSRNVRKGETAKLTVKTSEDVEAITVNGETIDSFTERHERTGWGWWAKTVTYREFTYTDTATVTKDYTVCAVNGKGVSSDAITATLTVRPSVRDWLHGIIGKWF